MTLGPRIPSFVQEIQFITYYLFNPCDVPLTAYFEVSRPIAGEIAIALLQFDFFQFVKTIFKPKWFRSGRHTRRRSRGQKKGGGIPETNGRAHGSHPVTNSHLVCRILLDKT